MEIKLLWVILLINLTVLLIVWLKLFANQTNNKSCSSIIVDSSGLIDGRILDIAKASFINAKLIIPKCVVLELQSMADKSDSLKRERARFGLDIIQQLQALKGVKVVHSNQNSNKEVDEQLVKIAAKLNAKIYSTDYNLQQVAQIAGVAVMNVNQLMQALRPIALPDEKLQIKLVKKGEGKNKNQAVGFLPDGTMVVVDKAKSYVNKTVTVKVTKVMQTVSGRMMFAELA